MIFHFSCYLLSIFAYRRHNNAVPLLNRPSCLSDNPHFLVCLWIYELWVFYLPIYVVPSPNLPHSLLYILLCFAFALSGFSQRAFLSFLLVQNIFSLSFLCKCFCININIIYLGVYKSFGFLRGCTFTRQQLF